MHNPSLQWDEFNQYYMFFHFKKEFEKVEESHRKQFLLEAISFYPNCVQTLIEAVNQQPDLQDFIKKMAVLI